ncbi:AAA family ATPase [Phascolarctobacterium faecium]|uniref:AAA family ATPase n=1 Tax=Phascolarctobacterium faecium TaxID=33025 RepID=UPI002E8DF9DE|nr:AAA family ATPase [Phascolarctobacterium faecium]
MKIKRLKLTNFKGHREFMIDFSETVTNIFGANGTGKTSIKDAFFWLLTGKDSYGRQDVDFRPFDEKGQPVHDVDVTVEAVLDILGVEYTLTRVLREDWSTSTGTAPKKLRGNTTLYFIDGAPKKAGQFDTWVQEYVNLDLLRLTSDPAYFPGLHWKEQREEIMALGGEATAADIIAEKPELEEIRAAVEKYGLTDFTNIVQKDLDIHVKTINEAKIRIDEASKSLTGLDDLKGLEEQARERILLAQKPVDELMEERAAVVSGSAVKNVTEQNMALESKLDAIKAKHRELIADVKKPYLEKLVVLDSDVTNAAERVRPLRQQYRIGEDRIKNIATTLESLRKQWAEIDEEIFDETECPCCHRPYDSGMVGKMLEEFNIRKSQSLSDIDVEGQKLSEEKSNLVEENRKLLTEINKYSGLEVEAPELKREILDAMAAAVSKARPLEAMEGFLVARDRLDLNKRKLEELQVDVKVQLRVIDDKLEPYQKALAAANETLAKIKMESETRERIARLTAERDNARHMVDDLQRKKSLVKLWNTTAAELSAAQTNGMFKFVSFRLFTKTLSTDDIKETCELTMNGVPYRNLSTAEKIIAGIDVINAISLARKVSNPIFIDNRESVVQLPECPEQVVNLIVSGADKEIRVVRE